jgi:uncharacterized protein YndB with AHSA1/START domain
MDILHDFYIKASPTEVFGAISAPHGLSQWWTKNASGQPAKGSEWMMGFGPEYDWRAKVSTSEPDKAFEFKVTKADEDWNGTVIGFELNDAPGGTQVRFYHKGWPQLNEHFRISSYCWAMYLRLLKMNLENGLVVPYEQRLEV